MICSSPIERSEPATAYAYDGKRDRVAVVASTYAYDVNEYLSVSNTAGRVRRLFNYGWSTPPMRTTPHGHRRLSTGLGSGYDDDSGVTSASASARPGICTYDEFLRTFAPNRTPTVPSAVRKAAAVNLHAKVLWARDRRTQELEPYANTEWMRSGGPVYPANFLTVAAHGTPKLLLDRRGPGMGMIKTTPDPEVDEVNRDFTKVYDLNAVIDQIDQSKQWQPNMPIYIDACEAGKGAYSLAQQLSDHYQTEVVAWDSWTAPDDSNPWGSHKYNEYVKPGAQPAEPIHFWPTPKK